MPDPDLLYSVAQIRAIENAALAALPPGALMERAGAATAQAAMRRLRGGDASQPVLVLAGPGNNGGDALEAARLLHDDGVPVRVLLHADPGRQLDDARRVLARAQAAGVAIIDAGRWREHLAAQWGLAIDGLFGIGLARAIDGDLAELVAAVNDLDCPLLAIDVPSGLDADTGNIVGARGVAVRASHTVTCIGNKPGLHTAHGADHAGMVEVAALGIDDGFFPAAQSCLNGPSLFAAQLKPRKRNSHKGSYGDLTVVGGAHGMAGAAVLAARAAHLCGAGRVHAAFLDTPPAYDGMHPELMCRPAQTHDFSGGAIVAGPGLGTDDAARAVLLRALDAARPLVLDADALNLIATQPALQAHLVARQTPAILTPHPLEAARLLSTGSAEIQADRLTAARALAARDAAIVVLKGAGSVIARPDGMAVVNTTGNPGLATAGTGDVLAGICGALLAQGWPAWEAALCAVWLHGGAADRLVREGCGPVGLTAGELIPAVRALLNDTIAVHGARAGRGA